MMIQLTFSDEDLATLRHERLHHPQPKVRRRMDAVFLKSQNLPHRQICDIGGISANTLRTWLRMVQQGGPEALTELHFYRPTSELDDWIEPLREDLYGKPPVSVAEAADRIEQITGLRRSPTQVRLFLKRLGMRPLKVGVLPGKADPDAQDAFKKK